MPVPAALRQIADTPGFVPRCRLMFQLYVHSTIFANAFNIFLDLLSCSLYIAVQASSKGESWFEPRDKSFWVIQLVMAFLYLFDVFITFFFRSTNINGFFMALRPIIEIGTSMPFIISIFWPHMRDMYVPTFLRCWCARVATAEIFRAIETTASNADRVLVHRLWLLVISSLCIIFTCTMGVNVIEQHSSADASEQVELFNMYGSLWFVFVTFSTIGYGDRVPQSWEGQLFVMFMILAVFVIIPQQIQDIVNVVQESNATGGHYQSHSWIMAFVQKGYRLHLRLRGRLGKSNPSSKRADWRHVVMTGGNIASARLLDMLEEFYADHHNSARVDVVVLCPPNAELEKAIQFSSWVSRIKYIRGSALNEGDLHRVRLKDAQACFIVSDESVDAAESDRQTILRAWSAYDYAPDCPLYVFIILPESRVHLGMAHQILCMEEVKFGLMAKNVTCHGAATLLINLCHTMESVTRSDDFTITEEWQQEYLDGLATNIYCAYLGKAGLLSMDMLGKSFFEAAANVFFTHGITLFAIKRNGHYHVNPGRSFVLQLGDVGFYLARSKQLGREWNIPVAMSASGINRFSSDSSASSRPSSHSTSNIRSPTSVARLPSVSPGGTVAPDASSTPFFQNNNNNNNYTAATTTTSGEQLSLEGALPWQLPSFPLPKPTLTTLHATRSLEMVSLDSDPVPNLPMLQAAAAAATVVKTRPSVTHATLYSGSVAALFANVGGCPGLGRVPLLSLQPSLPSASVWASWRARGAFSGALWAALYPDEPVPPEFCDLPAAASDATNDQDGVYFSPPPAPPRLSPFVSDILPNPLFLGAPLFTCHILPTNERPVVAPVLTALPLPFPRPHTILAATADSSGLYLFVMSLRRSTLPPEELIPIVLVFAEPPSRGMLAALAPFPLVYVMQGSISDPHALSMASVKTARQIIMTGAHHVSDQREEYLADASAIMAVHQLHLRHPALVSIIELMFRSNIKFLGFHQRAARDYHEQLVRRQQASKAAKVKLKVAVHGPGFIGKLGHIVENKRVKKVEDAASNGHPQSSSRLKAEDVSSNSSHRSLQPSSHPPSESLETFRREDSFRHVVASGSHQTGLPWTLRPSYVEGTVFSKTMVESIMYQSFYQPDMTQIFRSLLGLLDETDNAQLESIPLRSILAAAPIYCYGDLVAYLLLHELIPLGLYRSRFSNKIERSAVSVSSPTAAAAATTTTTTTTTTSTKPFPPVADDGTLVTNKYVYTNPPAELFLRDSDRVYVLRSRAMPLKNLPKAPKPWPSRAPATKMATLAPVGSETPSEPASVAAAAAATNANDDSSVPVLVEVEPGHKFLRVDDDATGVEFVPPDVATDDLTTDTTTTSSLHDSVVVPEPTELLIPPFELPESSHSYV
ncbi:hypothetical protein CAOG_03117 [Capsaspora owczarzaki ATCC 30864]|uniref:Potassium channel domain-containing protein n=1 Tax=Capsaspora owczarzaki (strain ATCC 30864) TaxID=595528 RepID=A0A0D2VNZ7_CAPO3|nr:hypothetical protein CAOG_03117 [Capsaspora owczarzaki ATCC 30864]KJE92092.1 hypothetical protein, variant [Capsaspora owczarzaki ATCC 30864]|eukprot:XP_004363956.2 hypothetical protein CAOG_03117 [Capsaspora owczarzaki ATCC 30864]